jgi:hypothetical protein
MPAGCCQSNIAVIVPASKSASMPSIVWKRLRASSAMLSRSFCKLIQEELDVY